MQPQEPIRVVVADDSFLIRESLTVMLGSQPGIELVAVCSDGKELEAAIAAEHPAVVIVDIRMPPTFSNREISLSESVRLM